MPLLQEQPHWRGGHELDGLVGGLTEVTVELGKPGERDLPGGFAQGIARGQQMRDERRPCVYLADAAKKRDASD
ncbi:hypothetical protein [Streptomyces sp. NRRL WC-3618]|uniref:hypothetical protein n=1 Tax=Streptomyces sp. NRRL WC-3618 TaxID=1519490 RepID=UPI00131A7BA3|nr:hypothetical protein [Streptomyces sp. NRRL WC-3618]